MMPSLFALALGLSFPAPADPADREAADLTRGRDAAEAFMRRASELALKRLDESPQAVKPDEIRETLRKHLAKARYFDSGTAPAELAEFSRQVKEAASSGVKLTDRARNELVKSAVLHLLDDEDIQRIEEEVCREKGGLSVEIVRQALASELRARIVRDLKLTKGANAEGPRDIAPVRVGGGKKDAKGKPAGAATLDDESQLVTTTEGGKDASRKIELKYVIRVRGYFDQGGFMIEAVTPDGPATRLKDAGGMPAGSLEAGDVILEVDGKPVKSPDDYAKAINAASDPKRLKLKIRSTAPGGDIDTLYVIARTRP
jgi:hypothetical protein